MNPTTDMLRIHKKIYQLNAENIPKLINRVQMNHVCVPALQIQINCFICKFFMILFVSYQVILGK